VECCVARVQGEAVDLASIRSQAKLGEFKQGELAKPHRRTIFEFDFGKAAFRCRKLKAFLDRGIHWSIGPFRNIRPLQASLALDKAEADNPGAGIRLARGDRDPQEKRRAEPQQHARDGLFFGCHGPPPQNTEKALRGHLHPTLI
jgi:hypothetical protein